MFKWYKYKKKQKLENIIKRNIMFNKWRIEQYKQYPRELLPPIKEFEEESGICKCFCEDSWKYLSKYNVDKELWEQQVQTFYTARHEYIEAETRIDKNKRDKEERKTINTFKKAILELKQEGKI